MRYKLIIVGGGISSLYFIYQYLGKNKQLDNVLLIEKQSNLGGKIYTKEHKVKGQVFKYEIGAGRFRKDHKNLMQIIQSMGLQHKMVKNGSDNQIIIHESKFIKWVVQNQSKLRVLIINHEKHQLVFKLKDLQYVHYLFAKIIGKIELSQLHLFTMSDLFREYLNNMDRLFLNKIFPYSGQFYLMNALDFYLNSYNDYFQGKQYYSIKGGLSQLVNKLKDEISSHTNIHLEEKVTSVYSDNGIIHVKSNKGKYIADKVILNISPHNVESLKHFNMFSGILNQLVRKSLYRIYAVYPKIKGKVWFHDIPRIVTNTPLRTIIPIDKKRGLIMISYTDYIYAEEMNQVQNKSLISFIQSILKSLFPHKSIPNPIFTDGYYWNNAVYYWKKGAFSYKYSNMDHLKKKNIYLMGTDYSEKQAWIEGGLMLANNVLEDITQN